MSGESDLRKLLVGMRPFLCDKQFAFATARSLQDVPAAVSIVGSFTEEEGVTIIASFGEVVGTALKHSGPWAKISLEIHSSLTAVGLTATIATALAGAGISANLVAGYFHDHVFVPWQQREAALAILNHLADERH
jgi:hypothetical protein